MRSLSSTERETSPLISGRRQAFLKEFERVQTENTELKRQLKLVRQRLKDLYERDSRNQQGRLTLDSWES